MYILKITNIEELLPNYGHHWAVMSETYSDMNYEDKYFVPSIQPYLWYHMIPEEIPDTYTSYLKEKLNIDKVPAIRAIMWWNLTVNSEATEVTLDHIFHINEIPFGIMFNPYCPRKMIIMTSFGFLPENRTIVYSGGDMWAQFPIEKLGKDYKTVDHMMSLFAIGIKEARKIIHHVNRYLEMRGNQYAQLQGTLYRNNPKKLNYIPESDMHN